VSERQSAVHAHGAAMLHVRTVRAHRSLLESERRSGVQIEGAAILHMRLACTYRLLRKSERCFDEVRLQVGFHAVQECLATM
jgi:hypothetical protein